MTCEVIDAAATGLHGGSGTGRTGPGRTKETEMATSTDISTNTTTSTTDTAEISRLIDTYLAAWVEPDAPRRAELVDQCWSTGGALVDPPLAGYGNNGISEVMAALQAHYPGHRFVRTSGVDHHHDTLRYSWELTDDTGSVALTGIDVGFLAADGRLQRISGFFGDLPTLQDGDEI
jgi:hypothetical protein